MNRGHPGRRFTLGVGVGVFLLPLLGAAPAMAAVLVDEPSAVIGSKHDLSPSASSSRLQACIFCHASHLGGRGAPAGGQTPLWNRELPVKSYNTYASPTYDASGGKPGAGVSKVCLSCHDGSIALGQTISKGMIPVTTPKGRSKLRAMDLAYDHPVGFRPVDDGQLAPSLFQDPPKTAEPEVTLPAAQVECTSCHSVHDPELDPVARKFLVRSNRGGTLCLACHDPARGQPNHMSGWESSAHAQATNTVPTTGSFGAYGSVDANACANCHRSHNTAGSPLQRGAEEETCRACHAGSNVTPAIPDVFADLAKTYAHPVLAQAALHSTDENAFPLGGSRHAECADCHQPHSGQKDQGGSTPPHVTPALAGASGFDGGSALRPSTSEYEVCFKCHADSPNKPQTSVSYSNYGHNPQRQAEQAVGDPKNLRQKFASSFARHNVAQPRRLGDAEVPSLRPFLLYENGKQGRSLAMGTYIYCGDCHASDSAARGGGSGADGPHGSIYPHIVAARYEQEIPSSVPGAADAQGVIYSPGPNGPYALCDRCHDIEGSILQDRSFTQHRKHVAQERTSCSTCHEPHGIQDAGGSRAQGAAMVSFDLRIVGADRNGALIVDGFSRECYLSCHGVEHGPKSY